MNREIERYEFRPVWLHVQTHFGKLSTFISLESFIKGGHPWEHTYSLRNSSF